MRTKLFASCFALAVAYGQEAGGVKGLLVDEAAAPIANADVQLKRHRSSAVYKQVKTTKDGTFQINDVAAGKYDILVMSAGCISQLTIGIRVRGGELLALRTTTLRNGPPTCPPAASYLPKIENVRLDSEGSQVVGSVIETEFAKPVSGASVVVSSGRTKLKGREVKTDSEGQFKLVGLPEGSYTVRVGLAGYSDFVVDQVPAKSGEETRIQRLEMRKCRSALTCSPTKYNQAWVACQ